MGMISLLRGYFKDIIDLQISDPFEVHQTQGNFVRDERLYSCLPDRCRSAGTFSAVVLFRGFSPESPGALATETRGPHT